MKNVKAMNKKSLMAKENPQLNELKKGLGLVIKKSDPSKSEEENFPARSDFCRSQTMNLSSPKKRHGNIELPSAKKSLKLIMQEKEAKRHEDLAEEELAVKKKLSDLELMKANSEIILANNDENKECVPEPADYNKIHDIDFGGDIKENDEEDSNNLKVVVRFRPINQIEANVNSILSVRYLNDSSLELLTGQGRNTFTLDRVFDSKTNQEVLFEEVAKSTIQDILKGYNGTIFTYGQSGSGKTHTMYGSSLFDQDLKGIIPRSIEYIFDVINDHKNNKIKFQIKFSMLEIYKESLYDLLDPTISSRDLKIKETKDKQVYVKNLTEVYINNIEDFLMLIDQADHYRVVSETGLNKQSSRSHLLFIIEISQELPNGTVKCGKLNLVDLAGSEKISKTGAVGETLEEAKKINLGLSALGNVISGLSGEKEYIPYRDSKLTRILQDSLGGNYKTTLIVACSPHSFNCEETAATLKFATRAKKIKNKVRLNIKKSPEELLKLVADLKAKLKIANEEIARLTTLLKENCVSTSKLDSPSKKQSAKDALAHKSFKKSGTVKYSSANSVINKQTRLSIPIKKVSHVTFENETSQVPSQRSNRSNSENCLSDRINELNKVIDLVEINEQDSSSSNTSINDQSHNQIKSSKDNEAVKLKEYINSKPQKNDLFNIQENSNEIMESKEDNDSLDNSKIKNYKNMNMSLSSKKSSNKGLVKRNDHLEQYTDRSKGLTTLTATIGATTDSWQSLYPLPKLEPEEEISKKANKSTKMISTYNPEILYYIEQKESNKQLGKCNLKSGQTPNNEQLFKECKKKDEAIAKLNREIEKLKSSANHLHEKYSRCKEKLNTYEENDEKRLNVDLVRVENALEKFEVEMKKAANIHDECKERTDSLIIEALERENLFLKNNTSKLEKDYLDTFKRIKLIANETRLETAVVDSDANSSSNKIFESLNLNESDKLRYKECFELGQTFMSRVLNFFEGKTDFFKTSMYDSHDQNIKDLEHLQKINVKNALMKSSVLAVFYEKQLLSIMNKVKLDLRIKEIESSYKKLYDDTVSQYPKLFESIQVLMSYIKKLKLEEISNLKSKASNSHMLNDQRKPQNFGTKCTIVNIPETILENNTNSLNSSVSNSFISQPANEKDIANIKKIKRHSCFDSSVAELKLKPQPTEFIDLLSKVKTKDRNECKSELSNLSKRSSSSKSDSSSSSSSSSSSCYEVKFDDANKRVNNNPNAKITNDVGKNPRISLNRRANIAINNVSLLPIFHLNKSINVEANKDQTVNQSIRLSMRNQVNIRSSSNVAKRIGTSPSDFAYSHVSNANNVETRRDLGDRNIYINTQESVITNFDYLIEIKNLKNEIETLKSYIQILNTRAEEEYKLRKQSEDAIKDFEVSSHKIYKKELKNMQVNFNIMRRFYDDEFEKKVSVIEGLSMIIDNLIINTGDQTMNYITTNNDRTIKSASNSLNLNNLKSVSALHKKTISFDEFSTQKLKQVSKNNMSKLNLSSKMINTTYYDQQNPLSPRSCITPIKSYFNNKKSCALRGEQMDSNKLADIFYDESGSATKKCDYIKLEVAENHFNVQYGTGLYCKNQGKSPLVRTLKFPPKGDAFNDSIVSEMINTEM